MWISPHIALWTDCSHHMSQPKWESYFPWADIFQCGSEKKCRALYQWAPWQKKLLLWSSSGDFSGPIGLSLSPNHVSQHNLYVTANNWKYAKPNKTLTCSDPAFQDPPKKNYGDSFTHPSLTYCFYKEHAITTNHSHRRHKPQSHGKEKFPFLNLSQALDFNHIFFCFKKGKTHHYFLHT